MSFLPGDLVRWWGPHKLRRDGVPVLIDGCDAQVAAGLQPGNDCEILEPDVRLLPTVPGMAKVRGSAGTCLVWPAYLTPVQHAGRVLASPDRDIWLTVLRQLPPTPREQFPTPTIRRLPMPSSSSSSLIAEIKARVHLPDLAAEAGVQLSNAGGGELAGKCPFHADSDPSFKVYTADDGAQRFKCFGCDAAGDVVDFWARYRGVTNAAAIEQLADRAGLLQEGGSAPPPRPRRQRQAEPRWGAGQPDPDPPAPITREIPPGLPEALSPLEGFVARAEHALQRRPDVLAYLREKRRLTDEVIHRARLGYEPNQDRIVLPVTGPDGAVIRCRMYDWQGKSAGNKMIWGPGTQKPGPYPLWALGNTTTVLLVEGEFDALCAISLGVPAVTGTGGAKRFAKEWAEPLAGYRVVLCYDVDPQGMEGVQRAGQVLYKIARELRVLTLPLEYRQKGDPKDMTDWVVAGGTKERLEFMIAAAPPFSPSIEGEDDVRDGSPVLDQVPGAPVTDDAVVPRGWRLRPEGLFEVKALGDGNLKLNRVLPMPVLVTGRIRNLDSGLENVELSFHRDGHWRTLTVDRWLVSDRNRIVQLSSRGLLATSNNGRALVQYLADYEAANLEEIPEEVILGVTGWKPGGSEDEGTEESGHEARF